ncbi:hypothetical protein IFM12276_12050 [Nocardia sputorum]|uniref:Uncharacterized protein n=1 Tax=Nocardia sputorum TaxID=2984338 RepID=A0ABN6TZ01_9NOCA|nr:hypothetical protein IFM12276_12050 [Nocardia sputorum]
MEADDRIPRDRAPENVVDDSVLAEIEQERNQGMRDHRDVNGTDVVVPETRHPDSRSR